MIYFLGDSRKALRLMPEDVKDIGQALLDLQFGDTPSIARPFGDGLPGRVWKLTEEHDKETYRVAFSVAFEEALYVLHAFQKKAKSGRATPDADRDLVASRLKDANAHHRERHQQEGKAK